MKPKADVPLWLLTSIALALLALGLSLNPMTRPMNEAELFEVLAASP
jgi:hypothetical protein